MVTTTQDKFPKLHTVMAQSESLSRASRRLLTIPSLPRLNHLVVVLPLLRTSEKATQQELVSNGCSLHFFKRLMYDLGYTPVTVSNGARSSAYTSYLKPIISRPNLDILLNTRALKLIHSGMSGRTPEFRVVQVAQSPSSASPPFS